MYLAVVPNRESPPAILLRESIREGKKVRTRTVANLSFLSMPQVEAMRRVLRGDVLVSPEDVFDKLRDRAHGAVDAVQTAMRKLRFDTLLDTESSRERDLVLAVVVARIVASNSKLGTTRWWQTTTLSEDPGIEGATEDDVYEAMDWLLARQDAIEEQLAKRHLAEGGLVLYDLSSSYFEGTTCPLAALGHSRDGKKGTLQVNYGLLTDSRGCPVSVSVFKGNTGDPTTLLPQVDKVRGKFKIARLVIVGDRGMITQKQIDTLSTAEGVGWITALKTGAIRKLASSGALQMGLFDTKNLFAVEHPDFPGERLVACKNHELGRLRAHKRESLLNATTKALEGIQKTVSRGRLTGKAEIGVRIGKSINRYKVAKHFVLTITDKNFTFERRHEAIAVEAAVDGIYVVRTSIPKLEVSDEDAVRNYKKLANVERAFRTMKSVSLKVRPIHHHLESRVRAHILLCMLAYYVEWHMREALRPLLFSDEDQGLKATRDPVAPAKRSLAALRKVHRHELEDGTQAHSFSTLLADLATITRSTCRRRGAPQDEGTFVVTTTPNSLQARALQLLARIAV